MTTIESIDYDELLDDERYPTDYALEVIRTLVGTPHQLVDFIAGLWKWGDLVTVREPWNGEVEVRFVTGGWSGNESLLSALEGTMFKFRWWESSHRGGLHVYLVNVDDWDRASALGVVIPREPSVSL